MLFVLPFRTEHSTYFILGKVTHFLGGLKHKDIFREPNLDGFISLMGGGGVNCGNLLVEGRAEAEIFHETVIWSNINQISGKKL